MDYRKVTLKKVFSLCNFGRYQVVIDYHCCFTKSRGNSAGEKTSNNELSDPESHTVTWDDDRPMGSDASWTNRWEQNRCVTRKYIGLYFSWRISLINTYYWYGVFSTLKRSSKGYAALRGVNTWYLGSDEYRKLTSQCTTGSISQGSSAPVQLLLLSQYTVYKLWCSSCKESNSQSGYCLLLALYTL